MQKSKHNAIEHAFSEGTVDVASYWQQVAVSRFSGWSRALSESETIRTQKALTRMRNGFQATRATSLIDGMGAHVDAASMADDQREAQQKFLSILGVKDVV